MIDRDSLIVIHSQIDNLMNITDNKLSNINENIESPVRASIDSIINNINIFKMNTNNISEEHCCSICQQNIIDNELYSKLNCNHLFHNKCLKKWLSINNSCPMCRLELEETNHLGNLIYLTIYFPDNSILYKSFHENLKFIYFLDKINKYINKNIEDNNIWINNTSTNQQYFDTFYLNKTLAQLNIINGSKINFKYALNH